MSWTVVRYEQTPNPNALKCWLDRAITDRPRSFRSADDVGGDPLASPVFAVDGVAGLLFNGDWMTVNKRPEAAWPGVKRGVEAALAALPRDVMGDAAS
ncbi:MAG: NifU N-terminal domain-containing protein [Planctomycetota bacterium]